MMKEGRGIIGSIAFFALKKKTREILRDVFYYTVLSLIAVAMVVPFVWMISSSLKTPGQVFKFPPQWIPQDPKWSNYLEVMRAMPFSIFTFNSFKIAILSTFGQLLTCSLAAYAFARMRFPGREAIFMMLIATMMIPGQVTMIPVFLIMRFLGWTDSHRALIVPSYFGGPFGTFLLRQFFLSIPTELEDAARIDGCGRFGIYWRIFLPLSKPAIATLAIFSFMWHWNDLLGPVIYLSTLKKMTLTVGLTYFRGYYVTQWHLLMAGSLISIFPILFIYAIAQKYFVRGIIMTGLKG